MNRSANESGPVAAADAAVRALWTRDVDAFVESRRIRRLCEALNAHPELPVLAVVGLPRSRGAEGGASPGSGSGLRPTRGAGQVSKLVGAVVARVSIITRRILGPTARRKPVAPPSNSSLLFFDAEAKVETPVALSSGNSLLLFDAEAEVEGDSSRLGVRAPISASPTH